MRDRTTTSGWFVPKISVLIPYRARPDNLRIALEAIARQTMRRSDFEVVIGSLDQSPEYLEIISAYFDRIDLVSVMTGGGWHGPRARNMALRQASGKVIVFVEADIVLPADFLQRLVDEHFSGPGQVCVIGELIGYADDVEVGEVEIRPLDYYLDQLADISALPASERDSRLAFTDPPMYWPLGWGALIAVTRSVVVENEVWFDEAFIGWGIHDQEWALQLEMAGVPMVFARGLTAVHMPHARELTVNFGPQFRANHMHLLRKWPIKQVELVLAYGWRGALERHDEILADVRATIGVDREFCVLSCDVAGETVVLIGVIRQASTGAVLTDVAAVVPGAVVTEVLPLLGRLLPFEDDSAARCVVLPEVRRLSGRMPMRVFEEASRVGPVEVADRHPSLSAADTVKP